MAGPATPTTLDEALARIALLSALVEKLRAENNLLRSRVEVLERRLSQTSQNSSRPPSSDPPGTTRPPKKKRSGRKPGGQPGHEGHQRTLLPPDQVDEVVDHWPDQCQHCRAALPEHLRTEVDEALRHQVAEIPQVRARIVEHRLHWQRCDGCGWATRADLPPDVPRGAFGPRLQAIVAMFTGAYRLSKRVVPQVLVDLFKLDMAVGSVSASEQAVSKVLAKPVDEARAFVQKQDALNADETGWRQRRQRAWLWVAVAASAGVAVFQIHWQRGKQAAEALLGRFAGYLMSDRWCAYEGHPLERRQLCWAHLKRHFEAMSEYRGKVGRLGTELVVLTKKMFRWWYAVRGGRMSRSTFRRRMRSVRDRIEALILDGAHCRVKSVRGMCWELHRLSDAMWTFVDVEGIEPTNNAAERALRHAVIWRKTSFGTHSEAGSRFVERMLTTVASLRLQGRNVLDFLTDAMNASQRGEPLPSLLPERHEPAALAAAA